MIGFVALNTVLGVAAGSPFGWLMRPRREAPERSLGVAFLTAILSLPFVFVLYLVIAIQTGALPGVPFGGA